MTTTDVKTKRVREDYPSKITLEIASFNTLPNKTDGKYYFEVINDSAEAIEVNSTGVYGITYKQVELLAAQSNVSVDTFLDAVNKGDALIVLPYRHCKEGEDFINERGVTEQYTKDWYKVNFATAKILLSADGEKYIFDVVKDARVAAELQRSTENRNFSNSAAETRRKERFLKLAGGNRDLILKEISEGAGDNNVMDGGLDETDEDDEPAAQPAKKTPKTTSEKVGG